MKMIQDLQEEFEDTKEAIRIRISISDDVPVV